MQRYEGTPCRCDCPVCHSPDGRILWTVNSREAAQHFVRQEADGPRFEQLAEHIESLWQRDTCEVVRCDACGFCFSHPYVAGDEHFYSLGCDRGNYPAWRWEYQLTYDVLDRQDRSDRTLLEIGAGDGAFVNRISAELIRPDHILCTEFSASGRASIQQHGIECISENFIDWAIEDRREHYDIICMFQVLEHMDQLDLLFEKLKLISTRGADVFIAVPNPKTIQFSELNGGLLDMPPNHIGRWNRKCFESIGGRWGFSIEGHAIEDEHVLSIAKTFLTYRFLRESQQHASLANRIRTMKNRSWRRAMQVLGVAINSITALPSLCRIRSDLGMSQWVHLVKASE